MPGRSCPARACLRSCSAETTAAIDRSDNGGSSWTALGGGGLQTGLVFNIDIKPDATASEVVCALQDNGLLTTAGVASPEWSSPQGGDGFDMAYDGVTAGRVYGTSGFWPAPCTRVFFSNVDGTDFPSTVPSSQDISPYGTTSDQGCGISDHDRPEQRRVTSTSAARRTCGRPGTAGPRGGRSRASRGAARRRRGSGRRQQRRDRRGRPGVRNHQRARHQRRHVHQHHPQPPGSKRSAGALRPDRPDRDLRRAWRFQRVRRARGTSSGPQSVAPRGPTSLRPSVHWPSRWTCRSTRSRSTAPRSRPRSTRGPTSAYFARWTWARRGASSTTSTSRGCRSPTWC